MACGYHQKNSSDPDRDCLHNCGCGTEIQCRFDACDRCLQEAAKMDMSVGEYHEWLDTEVAKIRAHNW